MKELLERAKELNPEIINHRRHLHQNPELGLHLPKTAAYVWEKLAEMGYQPQKVGDSGVAAIAGHRPSFLFQRRWLHACLRP